MKLVRNTGNDRVVNLVSNELTTSHSLDVVTQHLSIFGFAALRETLTRSARTRMILPPVGSDLLLLGDDADRAARNRLQTRWLANKCEEWLRDGVEVRPTAASIPQGVIVVRDADGEPQRVVYGAFSLTTTGLGVTPGNPLSLIQASETAAEAQPLSTWFEALWGSLAPKPVEKQSAVDALHAMAAHGAPRSAYALILHQLFGALENGLDEEQIVKSATGIRNTVVWNKLYKFQRDGVVGAIDKLNRFGGCIIADSVGLGKTFEALAIIKYHELRNDRVLVLVPKRLRDNWTIYKANDRRNLLAADRFNYDVLNRYPKRGPRSSMRDRESADSA